MTAQAHPPALILMGPTASGKSHLAIELAHALSGEIISVDSAMVYRGMDIGTAKPDVDERRSIPHHLIDILDPSQPYSAGQFRAEALALMHSITCRGKLPVLVGGTMLYFHALLHGIAELPRGNAEIRREIDAEAAVVGWAKLHARLCEIDPDAGRRIHPNDPQRIQRALEVYRITGRSLTAHCCDAAGVPIPFSLVKRIIMPESRAALHARIGHRFLDMIARGFVEEVHALFARGDLDESLPSIRSVGYRQVWAYLGGACDRAAMIERGIAATRQLAKRQFTWLRREIGARRYVNLEGDLAQTILQDVAPQVDRAWQNSV
jgi:tRNA dimethylallyltransferase